MMIDCDYDQSSSLGITHQPYTYSLPCLVVIGNDRVLRRGTDGSVSGSGDKALTQSIWENQWRTDSERPRKNMSLRGHHGCGSVLSWTPHNARIRRKTSTYGLCNE